jgi:hypothetical protein
MSEHKITRKQAAELIEALRDLAARSESEKVRLSLGRAFHRAGIPLLTPCRAEAHTNPHIDNCGVCAPRWGLVGDTVKVT